MSFLLLLEDRLRKVLPNSPGQERGWSVAKEMGFEKKSLEKGLHCPLVVLSKPNVTWFLFVFCLETNVLCLSSLGLISLLSFSGLTVHLQMEDIRKTGGCGCWSGKRLECLFSKPQGSPFEKHPAYLNVFVCMILNWKVGAIHLGD